MNLERVIELGVAAKTAKEQIEEINRVLKENTGFRGIMYDDHRKLEICKLWFGGKKGSEPRERLHKATISFLKDMLKGYEQDIKAIEEELKQSQNS